MSSVRPVRIGERLVGPGHPCFLIAEAGVNHNGDAELAKQLVDAAVDAGADAVKFQVFRADEMVLPDAPKVAYQEASSEVAGESQRDMLRRLELSDTDIAGIKSYCDTRGILFLASVFDEAGIELLVRLRVPALKIASGELNNDPLLHIAAHTGKPLIVSTGMSTLEEVEHAAKAVNQSGNRELVLLHCVSSYPANPEDCNLRAIHTLADRFAVPSGFSDHSLGIEVALAAVALGACVIEKHLTLSRRLPGPDHAASMEPAEMAALAQGIRKVQQSLGCGEKRPASCEMSIRAAVRRSLVLRRDIDKGERLQKEDVMVMRPGTGVSPSELDAIVGRFASRRLARETVLSWTDLA